MGIGDWFKRFRSNAEALEGYREGTAESVAASPSQAERAAHEHAPAPSENAPARDDSNGTSA
jgi:hypothetical protein